MDDSKMSVSGWLVAIFLTGLFQDPLRKILPGQPVWVLMLFLIPATAGVSYIGRSAVLTAVRSKVPGFGIPGVVITALAVATAVRFQHGINEQTMRLVLLGWVGPGVFSLGFVWGLVCCDQLCNQYQLRVLRIATITLGVFCMATFLELAFPYYASLPWLGPLPPKRPWFRTVDAEQFRMLSGLFRSPENAGWFSALLVPWATVAFAAETRSVSRRWLAILIGSIACATCLLAGRRKMQVMMVLAVLLTGLLSWMAGFRPEARRYFAIAVASICMGCGLVALLPQAGLYLGYFSSSPLAGPERTIVSAWQPILDHSDTVRWFGAGLGEMVPGRQHVGGSSLFFTEGGLVRIFVETGWFGLTIFSFIVLSVLLYCVRSFCGTSGLAATSGSAAEVQLSAAATAVLVASLFCFLIGHQIFGDPFVTFLTGAVFAKALPIRQKTRVH